MSLPQMEERVRALEQEMADVKRRVESLSPSEALPWFERVYGSFEGSAEFEEAMKLGRYYRESFKPGAGDEKRDGSA